MKTNSNTESVVIPDSIINNIGLANPNITKEDIDAVVQVISSGMLVQGENVESLETNIEKLTGVKYSAACANGTAALHLALLALNICPEDEVIVPAFSFVATANVVEIAGAKPVFVDIDPSTFNIDVPEIHSQLSSKTKAIIPVHEFGLSCDIKALIVIAKENNLSVIEDAACALGARQDNKHVGTWGNIGSFSFHPRKAITSGEGGMVISNDKSIIREIKKLRNHGIEIINDKIEFTRAGLNYRLTDFQAALLLGQLERLETTLIKRQMLANFYFSEIKNRSIILPHVPDDRNHTWQTFHIMTESNKFRDMVLLKLKEKGVIANYGAQCIPVQKYYQNKYGYEKADFPNAYNAYMCGMAIPIYEKLDEVDCLRICKIINSI